jgi:hypothetical protein
VTYEPVFLPLMVEDQPDTAERVRLAVQAIPFALPEKKLSHMSPQLPSLNAGDQVVGNAVSSGEFSARGSALQDSANVIWSQYGAAIALSNGESVADGRVSHEVIVAAPLPVAVCGIVGIGAKEQMVGVQAGAHVALMADDLTRRDGAVRGRPCQSMSSPDFPIPLHLPVTFTVAGEKPKQASGVRLRDGMLFKLAPQRGVVQGFVSHLIAVLSRSLVRVGIAPSTRFRPVFSTSNCRRGES